jgi:hypothetical protein
MELFSKCNAPPLYAEFKIKLLFYENKYDAELKNIAPPETAAWLFIK